MDNLKAALNEYKLLTEEISIFLDNENFDKLNELLDKREKKIEFINTLRFSHEEFKKISEELQLSDLEEKLNRSFISKRIELKNNIDNAAKNRNINNIYTKRLNVTPLFFNKKL